MDTINPLHADFYTQNADGEYRLKPRPQSVTADYIRQHVNPQAWPKFAELAAQTEQWQWFDEHVQWLKDEPAEPEQPELPTPDDEPNPWDGYRAELAAWQTKEPERPESRSGEQFMLDEGLAYERFKAARVAAVRAIAVEVDGMLFDGDEISQERLSRVGNRLVATGKAGRWKLADNSVADVTGEQLLQALDLAIIEQEKVWFD